MDKIGTDFDAHPHLTPEQRRVTQERGTEPPFTGAYWSTKTPGIYECVVCGQALYGSEAKFDSGTGWPSFWEPLRPDAVEAELDTSHGMRRTEIRCSRCGAHLGHAFPDGPPPTGVRHCVNSASLRLVPEEPG